MEVQFIKLKRKNNMKNILIIFILFFCIKCNTDNTNVISKITYYDNGKIKSSTNFITDTLKHGIEKFFYSTGSLKEETDYNYGKINGWQKFYNIDGEIIGKIHYVDNFKNGFAYYYFENGQIKLENFFLNDRKFGMSKEYFENKKLKRLVYKDFEGVTFYNIKNDILGKLLKEEGVTFSPVFKSNFENNNVKLNHETIIEIAVAQIPKMYTKIYMNLQCNFSFNDSLSINNFTAIYKKTFTKVGKYKLITIGEIKNIQGLIKQRDSVITEITVIP